MATPLISKTSTKPEANHVYICKKQLNYIILFIYTNHIHTRIYIYNLDYINIILNMYTLIITHIEATNPLLNLNIV